MWIVYFTLYNILSPFAVILAFIFSFFGRKFSFSPASFKSRLFPSLNHLENTVWFHCSSVGELNSIIKLIEHYRDKEKKNIVITTFTETGFKKAREITENAYLLPFDIYPLIKKFIKKINPQMVFIAETEIWPNLVYIASKYSKLYCINARLSANSYKYYLFLKPLLKKLLNRAEIIFTQNEEYASRLKTFVSENKIIITGNTKYDTLKDYRIKNRETVDKIANLTETDKNRVIVCGSTHSEDEKLILRGFNLLKDEIKNTKLIIAPRHIERLNNCLENINSEGFIPLKLSETEETNLPVIDFDVLVIDRIGILTDIYSIAAACFVGGTVSNIGGHNLLEPSIFSKPVLFGKNYYNQKEAGDKLIENRGGFIVNDEYEFKAIVKMLFFDSDFYQKTSLNSKKTLDELSGATDKIIQFIKDS